jgi:hypothetical protein
MGTRYEQCLRDARKRKSGTLCKEGYCSAKERYEKYPSALANGHALQVCSGQIAAVDGTVVRQRVSRRRGGGLTRWFREKWVNACDPTHPPCGRSQGTSPKRADPAYPYCRPTVRISSKTPTLLSKLTDDEIRRRCEQKQRLPATLIRSASTAAPVDSPPYRWLSYAQAAAHEEHAATLGVSTVARSPGGFMRVYETAGSATAMRSLPVGTITWERKRANFVKRHLAQYRVRPTLRRWLALVMWAYRPGDPPVA